MLSFVVFVVGYLDLLCLRLSGPFYGCLCFAALDSYFRSYVAVCFIYDFVLPAFCF